MSQSTEFVTAAISSFILAYNKAITTTKALPAGREIVGQ
jgi:hypothetical protein